MKMPLIVDRDRVYDALGEKTKECLELRAQYEQMRHYTEWFDAIKEERDGLLFKNNVLATRIHTLEQILVEAAERDGTCEEELERLRKQVREQMDEIVVLRSDLSVHQRAFERLKQTEGERAARAGRLAVELVTAEIQALQETIRRLATSSHSCAEEFKIPLEGGGGWARSPCGRSRGHTGEHMERWWAEFIP